MSQKPHTQRLTHHTVYATVSYRAERNTSFGLAVDLFLAPARIDIVVIASVVSFPF